jgi:hypothetical protein
MWANKFIYQVGWFIIPWVGVVNMKNCGRHSFKPYFLAAIVFTWGSAWIGSFAAWKCTMNQLHDRRSMMMFKRVLFLRIYWTVIRHSVPRWITVLGFSPANCDTSAFCGIDDWGLVKYRFSATQSSKRGRKRLANGMFLCQRWFSTQESHFWLLQWVTLYSHNFCPFRWDL